MVYITSTGSFLPGDPISNDQMENFLGFVNGEPSRAKRIVLRSNGIKSRHYALDPETRKPTFNNAQLTAAAVKKTLQGTPFERDSFELLAVGTTCPDQFMPSHGSMVHGELKGAPQEVISTAGVCCSSMAAMKYAYLSILAGDKNNAVVTGSEVSSKFMKGENFEEERVEELEKNASFQFEQEFLRWMLSDGAGAFLLQNKPNETGLSLKVDWIELISYANELPTCMYGGAAKNSDGTFTSWLDHDKTKLHGDRVLNIGQDTRLLDQNVTYYSVNRALDSIAKKRDLKADDYNWFVPHYSSDFFRNKLANHMNEIGFSIPFEKWFTTLSERGNVGSASILIYLDDLFKSKKLKVGDKILCFIPESSRFTVSYMQLTVVEF